VPPGAVMAQFLDHIPAALREFTGGQHDLADPT
jgi:hypothetical protein